MKRLDLSNGTTTLLQCPVEMLGCTFTVGANRDSLKKDHHMLRPFGLLVVLAVFPNSRYRFEVWSTFMAESSPSWECDALNVTESKSRLLVMRAAALGGLLARDHASHTL